MQIMKEIPSPLRVRFPFGEFDRGGRASSLETVFFTVGERPRSKVEDAMVVVAVTGTFVEVEGIRGGKICGREEESSSASLSMFRRLRRRPGTTPPSREKSGGWTVPKRRCR